MNSQSSFGQIFQYPGLFAALMGRTLTALATQTLAVAIGWQIYDITHSAKALGFVGLVIFLPMLFLVLPAGHLSDQFNRKVIVTICLIVETFIAIMLALGTYGGWLTPGIIYLLLMFFGCARAFEGPCQKTFLVNIVPSHYFPQATALSSSLFQAVSIIGPALGGVLYSFGADFTYMICVIGFGIAAFATSTIRFQTKTIRSTTAMSINTMLEGIRFIFSKPDILGAISLDLFAVLLGGATAMLPIYANDILHGSPFYLGLLRAAPAIGALIVSVILMHHPIKSKAGKWMFGAVFVFGFATIGFGLSKNLMVSIFFLAILGGADVVSVVVRSALVQLRTPDFMLGRVSAVNMLFIGSSNQLGEFESGMLASWIGPVSCVVFGGIGTILIAMIWIKIFPALHQVNQLEQLKPD